MSESKLRLETDSLHLPIYVTKNPNKIIKGSLVLNPRIVYTVFVVLYVDKIQVLLLSKEGKVFIDKVDKYAHVDYNFEFEDFFIFDKLIKNEKIEISEKIYNYYNKYFETSKSKNNCIYQYSLKLKDKDIIFKFCIFISLVKFENKSVILDKNSYKVFNHLGNFVLKSSQDKIFYIGLSRKYIAK
jgi:hypothetical protein